MIELGVRTRIASGDCLTILPEMTASVPFFRLASNWPACVVLSNWYLSIARIVFGPTDSRLLSVKVTPAAPSAPVTTTSDCCTGVPTLTGSFLPARSRCTVPEAVLISPASAARPAEAKPRRTAATIQRMRTSQLQPLARFYNAATHGGRPGARSGVNIRSSRQRVAANRHVFERFLQPSGSGQGALPEAQPGGRGIVHEHRPPRPPRRQRRAGLG